MSFELLEEMAANAYQWPYEYYAPRKISGVHDVLTTLSSQVACLSKQVTSLMAQEYMIRIPAEICDLCGGPHLSTQCLEENPFMPFQPEQAYYMGNQNCQNNSFQNTYNQEWQNHYNMSWRNNQNVFEPQGNYQEQAHQPPLQPKVNLEDALAQLTMTTSQFMASTETMLHPKVNLEDALAELTKTTSQFMASTEAMLASQATSKKNLEVQVGQVNVLNSWQPALPSDTEGNSKEHVAVEKEIVSNHQSKEAQSNEECSTTLLEKLPPKLNDPGSFSIPYSIGNSCFKALYNLSTNTNLMPLSVLNKSEMQIKEPKALTLELARQPSPLIQRSLRKFEELYIPPSPIKWVPPRYIFDPG